MRKYTRKPIKLTDVSAVAIRKPMKARDEIEEQAKRLRDSGWMSRPRRDMEAIGAQHHGDMDRPAKDDNVPELDGAFTYTGLGMARPKAVDKSHDVIVVKRKREVGEKTERTGRIFTNRRGFAD